ncbi:MAG: hypothetical protein HKN33_08155 [Pyrinomonadaceae bacterium]|nr:hypothetical protein [Pyrinomonadaceae bacterium]
MRKLLGIFSLVLFSSAMAVGQMTPVGPKKDDKKTTETKKVTVQSLTLPDGYDAGQVTGDIKNGTVLSSLRWAERSSVACFPGTRFEQFNGNHVFYRITLPAASRIKIEMVPKDGAKINLYALRQNMRSQTVPPDVTRAVSCEAKYPIYANLGSGRRVSNKDDGTRKIEYISVSSAYSILIGVAGAEGLTEGAFDLKIEIKSR